jgi:hypothetical protein
MQKSVNFKCFQKQYLIDEACSLKFNLNKFDILNQNYSQDNYRSSFYFQFSEDFDGIFSIKAKYPDPIPRSIVVMDLLRKHIPFNLNQILFIGSHCGAELFHTTCFHNAELIGIEQNNKFIEFSNLLIESYGLNKKIKVHQSTAENFDFGTNKHEFIIAHGLLDMSYDPIYLINKIINSLIIGGRASFEIYYNNSSEISLSFLGNGSGWGDTFSFSKSFLPKYLSSLGVKLIDLIFWGNSRLICVIEK